MKVKQLDAAELKAIFQGNKLVRYLGQGWNGGKGIRAQGHPDVEIPEEVEGFVIRLPNSTQTLQLERGSFSGSDHDHGHVYSWNKPDFVCTYKDPITGRPLKFSLFEWLGGNYNRETGHTDNYVTVIQIKVKESK